MNLIAFVAHGIGALIYLKGGNDEAEDDGAGDGPAAGERRRCSGDKSYGPGVSDTEIKLGQSISYSGPASAFSVIGRVQVAYFKMLNAQGGINGRKVELISLDNAFSPPKAVEASRKLVEDVGVLAEAGSLGTPTNLASQKYLNGKHVPQLYVFAGATRFNDPKNFPWTVPCTPGASGRRPAAVSGNPSRRRGCWRLRQVGTGR